MTWQAQYIQKKDNFINSGKLLEIGGGDFSTALYLATKNPDKQVFAVDYVLSEKALQNLKSIPSNFFLIKANACELNFLTEGFFDFIFSIAVGEHINDMQKHLEEMYRLLSTGGSYFFWAAPLWSSSIGHHLHHTKLNDVIPFYGHLYMSEDEISSFLRDKGYDPENAIYQIYHRNDLSRLTYIQYINIIKNTLFCKFDIEIEDDHNYNTKSFESIFRNNIYNVVEDELKIKGIKVDLYKI